MMKTYKIILAAMIGCCMGTAFAVDLTKCVPENSHAAVLVRPQMMQNQQSTLTSLQTSGDFERINKTLNLLSVSDSKVLSQDVLTTFFSVDARMMIVDSPYGLEEMKQRLNQRYVLTNKGKLSQTKVNDIPVLEFTWFHPSKPGQTRVYHLAFPENGTIVIGGHKDPLPLSLLSNKTSPEMTLLMANSTPQDALFFATSKPEVFHFNLMGIAKNCQSAFCGIAAKRDGIQIQGEMTPADPQKMQQLKGQLEALSNILLVGFFGGNQALYQTVSKAIVWKDGSSKIFLSGTLTKQMIESIDTHYRNNQNLITLLLARTIQ